MMIYRGQKYKIRNQEEDSSLYVQKFQIPDTGRELLSLLIFDCKQTNTIYLKDECRKSKIVFLSPKFD